MPTRMHGMRRRFFIRSLVKYLSIILLSVLLCILLMVWAYLFQVTGIIKDDTKRAASLSAMNFSELFQELTQMELFVDSSPEVHLGLLQVLQETSPSDGAFASLEDLARFQQVSLQAKPYILSFYIGKAGSSYVLVDGERIESSKFSDYAWLDPFISSENRSLVTTRRMHRSSFDQEGTPVVSLYQKTKYNEIIVANVRQGYFTSFLEASGHHVSLVDENGVRVLGGNSGTFLSDSTEGRLFLQDLSHSSESGHIYGNQYVVMARLVPFGLYFVDEIPNKVLFASLYRIVIVSIIVVCISICISVILSLFYSRNEYQKVCRILKVFDAEAPQTNDLVMEYSHGDVYVYILETAIQVLGSRAKLEKELLSHQVQLITFQLKALQYQINPHFMFNTLQAIDNAVLAEVHHRSDANAMIGIFSQLLRYCIADPTQMVSLEDEIAMTRQFVRLEGYRLGDSLQVFWDYDEAMLPLHTLRLVFEPLIENAIVHGRWADGRRLLVRISLVRRPGYLLASVFDNGPGVDDAELSHIRSLLIDDADTGHFGLKNVCARLELQFGKEYGMHLHSHLGHGFCVFFRIPADN